MRRMLAPLVLLAALLPVAASAAAPKPYTARYEVLRNGERLGEATIRFAALPNGRYDFSSSTRGSNGLAAVLGVSVDERSILRWHDGRPETVAYSLSQKVGWKDILELAQSNQGWAAYGKPQYGKFKLVHTNPDFSTSGLSAVGAVLLGVIVPSVGS